MTPDDLMQMLGMQPPSHAEQRASTDLRRRVTARAQGCREYCRSQAHYAAEAFSVEHILARAKAGTSRLENLALPIRCVASLCHSTTHGATAGQSTLRGEWTSQSSSRRYDDEN